MNKSAYLFIALITPNFIFNEENSPTSSFSECIHGYAKCIRCHVAKNKAGTDPLPNAAYYTRHRAAGNCRIYTGADYQEIPATGCPNHSDRNVQNLIDICGRAVTYHDTAGHIVTVEADPVPGRREHVPGGAYNNRMTVKPKAHRAEVWLCPEAKKYVVCLRDEHGTSLVTFECSQPPTKTSTNSSWFGGETDVQYALDPQMLAKATLYVDTNGITTAHQRTPPTTPPNHVISL